MILAVDCDVSNKSKKFLDFSCEKPIFNLCQITLNSNHGELMKGH